jgi:hypothetical protein
MPSGGFGAAVYFLKEDGIAASDVVLQGIPEKRTVP